MNAAIIFPSDQISYNTGLPLLKLKSKYLDRWPNGRYFKPSKLSPQCFTVVDNELTLIYGVLVSAKQRATAVKAASE